MQTDYKAFGIFRKEWRSRGWVLAGLAGVVVVWALFMFPHELSDTMPLIAFLLAASAGLGVTLFSREERDPARALLYLVPLSRGRILTAKLRVLSVNLACLFLAYSAAIAAFWAALTLHTGTSAQISMDTNAIGIAAIALLLAALVGPLFALVGAIVSQHVRSVIVSLILTLLIAVPMAAMAALPLLTSVFSETSNRLYDPSWRIAWSSVPRVGSLFLVLAALLCGWLYFLYCRTRVHELRPTPRALLVFVFGAAAIEVAFTLVFTGWRDLAYLVFGI